MAFRYLAWHQELRKKLEAKRPSWDYLQNNTLAIQTHEWTWGYHGKYQWISLEYTEWRHFLPELRCAHARYLLEQRNCIGKALYMLFWGEPQTNMSSSWFCKLLIMKNAYYAIYANQNAELQSCIQLNVYFKVGLADWLSINSKSRFRTHIMIGFNGVLIILLFNMLIRYDFYMYLCKILENRKYSLIKHNNSSLSWTSLCP